MAEPTFELIGLCSAEPVRRAVTFERQRRKSSGGGLGCVP